MEENAPPPEAPVLPINRLQVLGEAFGASAAVTVIVTLVSAFMVEKGVAISVAIVFLAATWVLVWQRDDARVEHAGLSLAGLVLPGKVDFGRVLRAVGSSLGWTLLCALLTFVPFFFGWKVWWRPRAHFVFSMPAYDLVNYVFGQLVIIALPEEAFYRGYLQTRFDDVFRGRVRILGAEVGWSLVLVSVIFAIGHFATIREPARLAVFFPSLLFGWLRARTKGVGAGILFHACCNIFSEILGRGFRVY